MIFYLFVAMFMHFAAGYNIVESILDPEMTYAQTVSIEEKTIPGWQYRYFTVNTFCFLFALVLVFIAYKYFKDNMDFGIWGLAYYVSVMVVLVISCLIVYVLSTEPVII